MDCSVGCECIQLGWWEKKLRLIFDTVELLIFHCSIPIGVRCGALLALFRRVIWVIFSTMCLSYAIFVICFMLNWIFIAYLSIYWALVTIFDRYFSSDDFCVLWGLAFCINFGSLLSSLGNISHFYLFLTTTIILLTNNIIKQIRTESLKASCIWST